MAEGKPLDGLLVVDISQGIAGPTCGQLFAEHGARVIKVEPPEGDWVRKLGVQIEGSSAPAIVYNRGKESVALDLKEPAAIAAVLKIAARAHVFLESGRPGAAERLGLGFAALRQANPDIVYISVSGYGHIGPYRERAMVDTVGQAWSGLMSRVPGRDGSPTRLTVPLIDVVTGYLSFQAATMALWGKKPGSGARHIDSSLMQAAAAMQAPYILEWAHVGAAPGQLNPPAGNYRSKDGWIAVTLVTEAQYRGICRAIGRPDLAEDPRFATFASRKQHEGALKAEIDKEMAKRSSADWVAAFEQQGALAQPIYTYGDWLADPHVAAADAAPAYHVAPGRALPLPRLPGEPAFDAPAPKVGEHTRQVLDEAGLGEAEIAALGIKEGSR